MLGLPMFAIEIIMKLLNQINYFKLQNKRFGNTNHNNRTTLLVLCVNKTKKYNTKIELLTLNSILTLTLAMQ